MNLYMPTQAELEAYVRTLDSSLQEAFETIRKALVHTEHDTLTNDFQIAAELQHVFAVAAAKKKALCR